MDDEEALLNSIEYGALVDDVEDPNTAQFPTENAAPFPASEPP